MDFLANLENILLSPEIGESYFQKAERGTPDPPLLAPPLFAIKKIKIYVENYSCITSDPLLVRNNFLFLLYIKA